MQPKEREHSSVINGARPTLTMAHKRYPESPTRSAELLRLALPLMSRQRAAPHPLSYAVWYEHVAGTNRPLSRAIEELTSSGDTLDDDQTVELYDAHVISVDEQSAQRVADGMRGLLNQMASSVQRAGTQTAQFDASLEQWNQQLGHGRADDAVALGLVLSETHKMRATMDELTAQLATSQGEIERLRREIESARDEALVDSLTGLANRRAFDVQLARILDDGDPQGCLILCDIDHFKRINDNFGHLFGDHVLKVVAMAIRSCVGDQQFAARVGGEEFAVLLPGCALDEGARVAERVRATVAASRIRRRQSDETIGQVTVSLGLAPLRRGEGAEVWYECADRALYASKQAGRNRMTLAGGESTISRAPATASG